VIGLQIQLVDKVESSSLSPLHALLRLGQNFQERAITYFLVIVPMDYSSFSTAIQNSVSLFRMTAGFSACRMLKRKTKSTLESSSPEPS